MNQCSALALASLALLGSAGVLAPGAALAQQKSFKDQLIGTWLYVSSTVVRADGTRTERPGLKGILIYTSDGHFVFETVRNDVPKLAANDLAKATPEEALAVVAGSIAYFGTYSVNEAEKVVIAKPEASTFANLVGGPEQKRIITSLTADELRFTNPRTPAGVSLEFVWKRAR